MSSSSRDGSAFQVMRATDGFRRSESAAGIRKASDMDTAEHSPQSYRIFGGMGIVIIIEIDPRAFRAASHDPARPYREFGL
jgi:hypothetical protein